MERAHKAAVKPPRCRVCQRTSLEGADFWRDRSELSGYQHDCVDCMGDRARSLRIFGQGEASMSFADIGRELGLTAERVRQIEASALRKLRNNSFVMSAIRKLLEGRS